MKKISLILLSTILIYGCNTTKIVENNFDTPKINTYDSVSPNTQVTPLQAEIVTIPEMESTPEIESFKFVSTLNISSKDFVIKLNDYKSKIQGVDLQSLSKWAKEKMLNYKLPDNFIDNALIEKSYETRDFTAVKIKSVELPSHNPLVKRFLYLIPVYDSSRNLKKVYVTIQGYVEE